MHRPSFGSRIAFMGSAVAFAALVALAFSGGAGSAGGASATTVPECVDVTINLTKPPITAYVCP